MRDPARTSAGWRRSCAPPAHLPAGGGPVRRPHIYRLAEVPCAARGSARGQPAAADALVDLVALPRLAATGLAAAGVTSLDRNWPV
ncbi:MAG: hypothetical protein QOE32_3370 [Pseudonocardiales bacterium]|nr:hypothetical protein [Pseudonocardiales bacterium]